MKIDLSKISTEEINKNTWDIDTVSTIDAVEMINKEDSKVIDAIKKQKKEIASLIDEVSKILISGGRVFYSGAGTSGRLGILDASEIFPTFGESGLFVGLIAGGEKAIQFPVESAEDNMQAAIMDLKKHNFSEEDILIGISASGRTPYVVSGIKYAKSIGASTGSIATSSNSEIGNLSDFPVDAVTGPETITGSTRMKSGSAQKMILNMISSIAMIRYGKVLNNLMIDIQPTNEKLKIRAFKIVKTITKCDDDVINEILKTTGFNVKITLVSLIKNVSIEEAKTMIKNERNLHKILCK